MTTFVLKLIAIITMTIDHIGASIGLTYVNGNLYLSGLIPKNIYFLCRAIGRIAFPIFCYLIVEGYYHTRNIRKYALRLFIFALISQVPFSLAFFKTPFDFDTNVYFTLFFGLICVYLADYEKKQYAEYKEGGDKSILRSCICAYFAILIIMIISVILHTDYSAYGIMLILLFYYFRIEYPLSSREDLIKFIKLFISIAIFTFIFSNTFELLGLLSLIPIAFHNHKKGPSMKYVFYAYYPVHLLILYGIFIMLNG
ncbi:MAG: conjugal transfer protein TraX [Lachnospiraceae bacterium]|nr:conjugal transfer protein TraX [Lachnospiraceae bacterium]